MTQAQQKDLGSRIEMVAAFFPSLEQSSDKRITHPKKQEKEAELSHLPWLKKKKRKRRRRRRYASSATPRGIAASSAPRVATRQSEHCMFSSSSFNNVVGLTFRRCRNSLDGCLTKVSRSHTSIFGSSS